MLKKLPALPILTFILLTEAIAQQAQPPTTPQPPQGYWPGPWHMWGDGYAWPHFWFGPLMMILFAVSCMAVMYFIMRGRMGHGHRSDHALELLKERFARGEIDQAEYEKRRRLLEL